MAQQSSNAYSSLILAPDVNIAPALLLETSPLEYRLQDADFHVFTRGPTQPIEATLDNATGIGMAWALKRIIRFILRAGCAELVYDPNLPAGVYPYVPPHMFEMIGLSPPHILALTHLDTVNMLSMLAPRDVIESIWRDFQQVGHDALAWIDEARARCRLMGPSCGWDWDGARITNSNDLLLLQDQSDNHSLPGDYDELGYPDELDHALTMCTTAPMDDTFSMGSDSDLYMTDDDIDYIFNHCRDIVLHPYRSRIIAIDPYYNVFSGQDLINEDGDLIILGQY